jgi:uncharacterized paraquat-inducible protein A
MKVRNIIAVLLVLLSLVLLVPGLTQPLITISASIEFLGAPRELFRETRSIIQTVRSLHESGNDFVAGLIFFFGIVVPFAKALALGVMAPLKSPKWRRRIYVFVRDISKWAMNDVFVVAVYVAFLSAKATDNLDAKLETGFYYFAGYCLVSLVSLQLMKLGGNPARVEAAERGPDPASSS